MPRHLRTVSRGLKIALIHGGEEEPAHSRLLQLFGFQKDRRQNEFVVVLQVVIVQVERFQKVEDLLRAVKDAIAQRSRTR